MTQKGNPRVLSLGTAQAERGQRTDGWLEVGRRTDNTPLETPVILVNGGEDGPALWIQSAIHGDEFDGMSAIWRVLAAVDPRQLRGSLILFPALNISAFEARQRVSPVDGLDVNRVFPGDPHGSYTRRLAHVVEQAVLEYADFLVDLHGGGNEFSVVYYTLYHAAPNAAGAASEQLAKAAGSRLVWGSNDLWLQDGLFTRVTKAGIPAMLVECGGEGRLHEHNVHDHERSLINMMRHLGMIDGAPEVPAPDAYVDMRSADFFHGTMGGVVTALVKLGELVEQGQPVVQIRDVFGHEVEVVTAPSGPAVLLAVKTYGVTNGGAPLGILGVRR